VGVASDLISIGNIYIDLSNYKDPLPVFKKAIEMYEQIGQKLGIAKSFGIWGRLCHFIELFRRNEMLSEIFRP